jgi:signal transduction histidine kinase
MPTLPASRSSQGSISSAPVPDRSLAVAVHDLNNLLAVVAANTSLLAESLPADHEDHELVGEIEAAVERASLVTKQLGQMAREVPVERPSQVVIDPTAITQRVRTLRDLEPMRA